MSLKLLFDPVSGAILGAQAVGTHGVDKRIDVLAMAIQARMTVFDLEAAELAYAPQFGAAKDPINMACFIAAGVIRGESKIAHLADMADTAILDDRMPTEFISGHIPGTANLPIDQLRDRLDEVDLSNRTVTYCQVGKRGYLATRILSQSGYAANLSGGYVTYCQATSEAGDNKG
jgi:rhodanese-related sulfurtransferase